MTGIRHPARFLWRGVIQPCLGWLLFGWLAALVPKTRGQVAVFGSLSGQFADNSKYLFLSLVDDRPAGSEIRYVSDCAALTASLQAASLPVLAYPSLPGLWYLLRCETVVADGASWVRPLRYPVLWRARKVQLWHGCPLKRIELDYERIAGPRVSPLLRLSQRLIGRFPRYDVLLSPSPRFTDISFQRAFNPRQLVEDDYPRNVVFHRHDPRFQIGTDPSAAEAVASAHRAGLTTVFYMPTFRDTGRDAVIDGALDLARLDRFALEHRMLFVLKLHPLSAARIDLRGFRGVVGHGARTDVYPLLPHCDVLVTDYSSVFFDFLRTNRPIVFFPYDLDGYQESDRALYFDYERLVPGPICRTQDALEATVRALAGAAADDRYAQQRADVMAWAFVGADGDASARIARSIWPAPR